MIISETTSKCKTVPNLNSAALLELQPGGDEETQDSDGNLECTTWNHCFGRYGGFLKWGYPPIINFHGIFHYIPSILGVPLCQEWPISIFLKVWFNIHGYFKNSLIFEDYLNQHLQETSGNRCSIIPTYGACPMNKNIWTTNSRTSPQLKRVHRLHQS